MNTMHRHNSRIAAIGALCSPWPIRSREQRPRMIAFEKLSVYLERNVQDRDAEIRFEVTGATDGLAALKVMAPGARTVIDLRSPELGTGEFAASRWNRPEPDDDKIVRADFPAGTYRFEGTTTKGAHLRGEAQLSHVFPEPAAFEYPRPDQKDVPATALTLRWSVPKGIEVLCHRDRANRLGRQNAGTAPGAKARMTNVL